jgi:UDPglucose 6-dehydrogenase
MKISIIGTGYVGLVAGACFADNGYTVYCVDLDQTKIENLKKGIIPIYEPGLEDLVKRNVNEGRLKFTTQTGEAVQDSEIIFMAVGTPPLPNGEPDLQYLKSASEEVGRTMNGYKLIVNKSTVPIGSHQVVAEWVAQKTKHDFDVVSNPEFLKEGSALDDFLKPDRVIIGTTKESAYKKMAELYAPFVRQGNPIIWMDPVSAEMAKYACNAFLATRISFMNELSQLCEKVGGDIEDVRKGMITDVRIGKYFLYAGAGYGGSCFPKDVKALISTGTKNDVRLGIVAAADEANNKQKHLLVSHIKEHFNRDLAGKTVAVWGLAFKPNTDDIREAPALVIIDELTQMGAKVRVFDPVAMEKVKQHYGTKANGIHYCTSIYDTTEGADAAVLVTEWNEFRNPDFDRIKKSLKSAVLFDGRNIYNPGQMKTRGFKYYGIGRRPLV